MQITSELILDLLIKHFVVGSITGMVLFGMIKIALPLMMSIRNKMNRRTDPF